MEIDRITYQFQPSVNWCGRLPDEYAIVTPKNINAFMGEILLAAERLQDSASKAKIISATRRFVSSHIFGQKAVSEFDNDAGDRLDRAFLKAWNNTQRRTRK